MPVKSFEDQLLKGWALIGANATSALELLREIEQQKKMSPVVRLVRADACIRASMEAMDSRQMLELAVQAIDDAEFASCLMVNDPSPKEKKLRASLLASHAAQELGYEAESLRWQRTADDLFEDLEDFIDHPGARRARMAYANFVGRPEAEEEVFQDFAKDDEVHPFWAQYCAQVRFRRREYEEAAKAYERGRGVDSKLSRFVGDLSEMTLERAPVAREKLLSEVRESIDDRLNRTGSVLLVWDWVVFRLLGADFFDEDVQRIGQGIAEGYKAIPNWESFNSLPVYMLSGDETRFLDQAATRRTSLMYAHFLVGVDRLAEGRRAEAIDHFEKAVATGAYDMDGYGWAKAFLVHLDPNAEEVWLPWLVQPGHDERLERRGNTQKIR